jgi:DNA-directed RNA polymerase subunit RPC12/RpoP
MSLSNHHCPGAARFREPTPEYTICPNCQAEVEIWSDEPLARCPSCGYWVSHEIGASCLDWCPKASECVGLDVYERLRHSRPTKPEGG